MKDRHPITGRILSPSSLYPARNFAGKREVRGEEIWISVFRAGQGAMPLPSRGGQNG
jgi:hypothetical protein